MLVGTLVRVHVLEAVRSRALRALAVVTVALLAILALAADQALGAAADLPGTLTVDVAGTALLGTASFVALLLGSILATFCTHAAVIGAAETGELQPLLVRPAPWAVVLAGRLLAAIVLASVYTALLWAASVGVVAAAGGWSPDAWVRPGAALALAVALVALASLGLSTVLGAAGAGVATLTLLGLGVTAGLLAELGTSFGVTSLSDSADVVSAVLPFEALYRDVLATLAEPLGNVAQAGIDVGPFGGPQAVGAGGVALIIAWAAVVAAATLWRTSRLDFA